MIHNSEKNGTKWTFLREDKINLATVYPNGDRFTVSIHFADQPLPVKFHLSSEEEVQELYQQFIAFESMRIEAIQRKHEKNESNRNRKDVSGHP